VALRRRPNTLSREQSLGSIPLRNEAIEVVPTEDGSVRLIIPRRETRWVKALSRLFTIPERRPLTLDEIGSFVWNLCDGQHTVRQIVKALCGRYRLHRKEAEVSVVTYLRQLAKRGIIGIAVARAPKENAPS